MVNPRMGQDCYGSSSAQYLRAAWFVALITARMAPALGICSKRYQSGVTLGLVEGHSYTVEIEVEVEARCESGLLLFYNPAHATDILLGAEEQACALRMVISRAANRRAPHAPPCAWSTTARRWISISAYPANLGSSAQESAEISGMHHNVIGGFLDVRPAVYACGSGKAT